MFEVGDYVVYGNNGVCQVESVGPIKMPGVTKERLYYTLTIHCAHGGKVFTPVDSDKVRMRSVMSKDEAKGLLNSIPELSTFPSVDQRKSEAVYRGALQSGNCMETLKVVKTLQNRKKERQAEGKNMNVSDEKYLRIATTELYGELAMALDMDITSVENCILDKIES
ncbi:MAG: CarD family transcriptional regulator [Lachnospiraceae bacterium]|nr:CarD family transcriptional regulator [Lachnospiraceae bacterium]